MGSKLPTELKCTRGVWLAQGQLDLAARWADYCQVGETEYLREFEDLTLARVRLAQGHSAGALALPDTDLANPTDLSRVEGQSSLPTSCVWSYENIVELYRQF